MPLALDGARGGASQMSRRLTVRHQSPEAGDRAASARPGPDSFAPGADIIVVRNEVEAVVEVEVGTVLAKLRPKPPAAPKEEVDAVVRQPGAADRAVSDALRALLFGPFDRRALRPNWNAHDQFFLHDQGSDLLAAVIGGRRGKAEHGRQECKKEGNCHAAPNVVGAGFAARP